MTKAFRLPKEFAEKWLAALRSGEYKQGSDFLMIYSDAELGESGDECLYCCLGVAGKIAGADEQDLWNVEVLYPGFFEELVPKEIIGEAPKNKLVAVLSSLNDGVTPSTYNQFFKENNYVFRHTDIHQDFSDIHTASLKLNFNEIADFIEDNCEFYESR